MKHQINFFFLLFYLSVLNVHAQTSDSFRKKAESLFEKEDYKNATIYYQKAFKLAQSTNDYIRMANLCVDISTMEHIEGHFANGATLCRSGLNFMTKSTNKPDSTYFKLYSSLGEMYKKLNRNDSSIYFFELGNILIAKKKFLEKQIPDYVAFHFSNQAIMYYSHGDYQKAINFTEKGLTLVNTPRERAIILNNIANYYEKLGDVNKAYNQHLKSLSLYSSDDFEKCKLLIATANDLMSLKKYSQAKEYFIKSQQLFLKAQKRLHLKNVELDVKINYHLGQVYSLLDDRKKGLLYLNQAKVQYHKEYGKKGTLLAMIYLEMAKNIDFNNNIKALNFLQSSLETISIDFIGKYYDDNPNENDIIDNLLGFYILKEKGKRLFEQFKITNDIVFLKESIKSYDIAINLIRKNRKRFEERDSKQDFIKKIYPVYEEYVSTLFEMYQVKKEKWIIEKMFSVVDEGKNSTLSDFLRASSVSPQIIPTEQLNKERRLNIEISQTKIKLNTINDSLDRKKLNELIIQKNTLIAELEKQYPAFYHLKYDFKEQNISDVKKKIKDGTTLVSYFITSSQIFIFTVTQNDFQLTSLPIEKESILKTANLLVSSLNTNPLMGKYNGSSYAIKLYQYLIQPIENQLKKTDKLIILPDWQMGVLPFEVLERGRYKDEFLTKKYAISYLYSSKVLTPKSVKSISNHSILAFAPFTEKAFDNLPQLPESINEVNSLSGIKFVNSEATKEIFLKNASSGNIIHLATHTQIGDSPFNSYINFYPEKNKESVLHLEELFNLQLPNSQLITLSSCEAGTGQMIQGDGIMSLAKGFAYTGCPAIISTLWTAHDESLSFLSIQFYKYLKMGYSKDISLQLARKDYFTSKIGRKFNHPFYWANFVLIGNNEALYPVTKKTSFTLSILLVLILIGVISIYFLRFKRK